MRRKYEVGMGTSGPTDEELDLADEAGGRDDRPRIPCDFCGELILKVARKCKHCGEHQEREIAEAPAQDVVPVWERVREGWACISHADLGCDRCASEEPIPTTPAAVGTRLPAPRRSAAERAADQERARRMAERNKARRVGERQATVNREMKRRVPTLSKVASREDGTLACPNCGGTQFKVKRSAKAKGGAAVLAPMGLFPAVLPLAKASQVKCVTCGKFYKRK